ncbi:MAG: hypothetical protein HZB50_12415 [Chloroflexi bacterium]|nr:hypothetical protein [Chloroflexota bacterium]
MVKKIFFVFLIASLLSSCISVKSDSATPTSDDLGFVTSTLAPTKAGFVPATLTPSPAAETPSTLAVTAPANCKDSAVLLRDVTIPDNTQMKAGEKFTKTWEFQNTGECPWTHYTLEFSSGDQMNAPLSAPIADTAPNSKVQVSVELTAPKVDGVYTGYFTLNNASGENLPIGIEKTFWVMILVGDVTPQPANAGTPYIPGGGNSNCAYTPNSGYVQQLISLINEARAEAKLPALTVNAQLTSAAQGHSADMACNNFLSHTGSDGLYIGARLSRAGYPTTGNYLEIIAIGTPQDAMSQWRADAPHWESVLDPTVTEIGVGYAYYLSSDFGGYITVDMGAH